MSSFHNDPTEYLSAIHGEPTQPMRAYLIPKGYIPGYLWADQEEWEEQQANKARQREALRSLEKQGESIFALTPIIIFLTVFAQYSLIMWVCMSVSAWPWGQ